MPLLPFIAPDGAKRQPTVHHPDLMSDLLAEMVAAVLGSSTLIAEMNGPVVSRQSINLKHQTVTETRRPDLSICCGLLPPDHSILCLVQRTLILLDLVSSYRETIDTIIIGNHEDDLRRPFKRRATTNRPDISRKISRDLKSINSVKNEHTSFNIREYDEQSRARTLSPDICDDNQSCSLCISSRSVNLHHVVTLVENLNNETTDPSLSVSSRRHVLPCCSCDSILGFLHPVVNILQAQANLNKQEILHHVNVMNCSRMMSSFTYDVTTSRNSKGLLLKSSDEQHSLARSAVNLIALCAWIRCAATDILRQQVERLQTAAAVQAQDSDNKRNLSSRHHHYQNSKRKRPFVSSYDKNAPSIMSTSINRKHISDGEPDHIDYQTEDDTAPASTTGSNSSAPIPKSKHTLSLSVQPPADRARHREGTDQQPVEHGDDAAAAASSIPSGVSCLAGDSFLIKENVFKSFTRAPTASLLDKILCQDSSLESFCSSISSTFFLPSDTLVKASHNDDDTWLVSGYTNLLVSSQQALSSHTSSSQRPTTFRQPANISDAASFCWKDLLAHQALLLGSNENISADKSVITNTIDVTSRCDGGDGRSNIYNNNNNNTNNNNTVDNNSSERGARAMLELVRLCQAIRTAEPTQRPVTGGSPEVEQTDVESREALYDASVVCSTKEVCEVPEKQQAMSFVKADKLSTSSDVKVASSFILARVSVIVMCMIEELEQQEKSPFRTLVDCFLRRAIIVLSQVLREASSTRDPCSLNDDTSSVNHSNGQKEFTVQYGTCSGGSNHDVTCDRSRGSNGLVSISDLLKKVTLDVLCSKRITSMSVSWAAAVAQDMKLPTPSEELFHPRRRDPTSFVSSVQQTKQHIASAHSQLESMQEDAFVESAGANLLGTYEQCRARPIDEVATEEQVAARRTLPIVTEDMDGENRTSKERHGLNHTVSNVSLNHHEAGADVDMNKDTMTSYPDSSQLCHVQAELFPPKSLCDEASGLKPRLATGVAGSDVLTVPRDVKPVVEETDTDFIETLPVVDYEDARAAEPHDVCMMGALSKHLLPPRVFSSTSPRAVPTCTLTGMAVWDDRVLSMRPEPTASMISTLLDEVTKKDGGAADPLWLPASSSFTDAILDGNRRRAFQTSLSQISSIAAMSIAKFRWRRYAQRAILAKLAAPDRSSLDEARDRSSLDEAPGGSSEPSIAVTLAASREISSAVTSLESRLLLGEPTVPAVSWCAPGTDRVVLTRRVLPTRRGESYDDIYSDDNVTKEHLLFAERRVTLRLKPETIAPSILLQIPESISSSSAYHESEDDRSKYDDIANCNSYKAAASSELLGKICINPPFKEERTNANQHQQNRSTHLQFETCDTGNRTSNDSPQQLSTSGLSSSYNLVSALDKVDGLPTFELSINYESFAETESEPYVELLLYLPLYHLHHHIALLLESSRSRPSLYCHSLRDVDPTTLVKRVGNVASLGVILHPKFARAICKRRCVMSQTDKRHHYLCRHRPQLESEWSSSRHCPWSTESSLSPREDAGSLMSDSGVSETSASAEPGTLDTDMTDSIKTQVGVKRQLHCGINRTLSQTPSVKSSRKNRMMNTSDELNKVIDLPLQTSSGGDSSNSATEGIPRLKLSKRLSTSKDVMTGVLFKSRRGFYNPQQFVYVWENDLDQESLCPLRKRRPMKASKSDKISIKSKVNPTQKSHAPMRSSPFDLLPPAEKGGSCCAHNSVSQNIDNQLRCGLSPKYSRGKEMPHRSFIESLDVERTLSTSFSGSQLKMFGIWRRKDMRKKLAIFREIVFLARKLYKIWRKSVREAEKQRLFLGDPFAWGVLPVRAMHHPDLWVPLPAGYQQACRAASTADEEIRLCAHERTLLKIDTNKVVAHLRGLGQNITSVFPSSRSFKSSSRVPHPVASSLLLRSRKPRRSTRVEEETDVSQNNIGERSTPF